MASLVSTEGSSLEETGDSRVRLAASQVIERPPAEVFGFVATEHFENHAIDLVARAPDRDSNDHGSAGRPRT
jgi:hypothetical protein